MHHTPALISDLGLILSVAAVTTLVFKKIKQLDPSYPAKFALFDTGSHGTPIRMTDWRLILNWMLQVDGA